MFVLCPHCQFLVALDPATGQPPLRCPRCDGPVQPAIAQPSHSAAVPEDATAVLPIPDVDAVPPPAPSPASAIAVPVGDDIENDEGMPDVGGDAVAPLPPSDAAAASPNATTVEAAPGALPTSSAPRKHAPSFVRGESARPGAPRRWWVPASLAGLTVLLLLQIALADRARLAADSRWRPALLHACTLLGCELPPWREPDAITLLDRDVRPDPRRPGVLHATASFRNDAHWPQPWPMLSLTLSDAEGRVTGARVFTPSEYLHAAGRPDTTLTQNGLASGQSASIALEVIEPAPRTVAFTFEFR